MFDTMISQTLIKVIWVIASIAVVIFSFSTMIVVGGGGGFLLGLVYLVLGLAWIRVICEAMIIIFVMNDNLRSSAISLRQLVESQNSLISKLSSSPSTTSMYVPSFPETAPAPETATSTVSSRMRSTMQTKSEILSTANDAPASAVNDVKKESKSRLGEWPST